MHLFIHSGLPPFKYPLRAYSTWGYRAEEIPTYRAHRPRDSPYDAGTQGGLARLGAKGKVDRGFQEEVS